MTEAAKHAETRMLEIVFAIINAAGIDAHENGNQDIEDAIDGLRIAIQAALADGARDG